MTLARPEDVGALQHVLCFLLCHSLVSLSSAVSQMKQVTQISLMLFNCINGLSEISKGGCTLSLLEEEGPNISSDFHILLFVRNDHSYFKYRKFI